MSQVWVLERLSTPPRLAANLHESYGPTAVHGRTFDKWQARSALDDG
jgi:hypothetical protein